MRGLFFWTLDIGRWTEVIDVGFISVSRRTAFDSAPRYKKRLCESKVFFLSMTVVETRYFASLQGVDERREVSRLYMRSL